MHYPNGIGKFSTLFSRIYTYVGGFLLMVASHSRNWSSKTQLDHRKEQCKGCFANQQNFCSGCGCYIPFKQRVADAKCPHGIWKQ